MAGAPKGNKNSSKTNRLWADTIRRALVQGNSTKLRNIADKLVEMAEGGNIMAMREIGDRLDGKVVAVEVSGPDGEPIQTEATLNVTGLSTAALSEIMALRDGSNRK